MEETVLALWSITFFSSALLKLIEVTSVQKVVTLKSNNELKHYQAYLANLSCSTVFFLRTQSKQSEFIILFITIGGFSVSSKSIVEVISEANNKHQAIQASCKSR